MTVPGASTEELMNTAASSVMNLADSTPGHDKRRCGTGIDEQLLSFPRRARMRHMDQFDGRPSSVAFPRGALQNLGIDRP